MQWDTERRTQPSHSHSFPSTFPLSILKAWLIFLTVSASLLLDSISMFFPLLQIYTIILLTQNSVKLCVNVMFDFVNYLLNFCLISFSLPPPPFSLSPEKVWLLSPWRLRSWTGAVSYLDPWSTPHQGCCSLPSVCWALQALKAELKSVIAGDSKRLVLCHTHKINEMSKSKINNTEYFVMFV